MKLEEYQNALNELESKFGKDSSKTLLKIIDMANLETLEKMNQLFDQKFNDFKKEIIEDRKDIHKSINSMVFKIAGLFSVIIALVAGIVTIIRFLPDLF